MEARAALFFFFMQFTFSKFDIRYTRTRRNSRRRLVIQRAAHFFGHPDQCPVPCSRSYCATMRSKTHQPEPRRKQYLVGVIKLTLAFELLPFLIGIGHRIDSFRISSGNMHRIISHSQPFSQDFCKFNY